MATFPPVKKPNTTIANTPIQVNTASPILNNKNVGGVMGNQIKAQLQNQGAQHPGLYNTGPELFSEIDPGTETEFVQLDERTINNRDGWVWQTNYHNYRYRVHLKKVKEVVIRADRNGFICEYLEGCGLTEPDDWYLDSENNILYLEDSFFLISLKLKNVKQFQEAIEYIEIYKP